MAEWKRCWARLMTHFGKMPDRGDSMTVKDFFDKPYMGRQLVVFLDDKVIEAKEKARKEQQGQRDVSWSDVFEIVKMAVMPKSVLMLEMVITALAQSSKKGVSVFPVKSSLSPVFNLPPGHPRESVLYVGHPAVPQTYMPIADFHRFVFEHKFSEAVNLLMHLGAKEINVEHVCGWGSDFAGRLSVSMPPKDAGGSAQAARKAGKSQKILYEAKFTGDVDPCLPDDLVWYHHEPTWKNVADGRLKFGMTSFSLNLQYSEDYGVNASMKAKVAESGFDLGGEFEKHSSTTWQLTGKF